MIEEDGVQIDLFVFWRYHNGEVSTFVGGRSDRMRHDGKCRVPAYGSTWWITPDCILPAVTGENILASIKEEEKALRNEIQNARKTTRARIENLIFPKLIKIADDNDCEIAASANENCRNDVQAAQREAWSTTLTVALDKKDWTNLCSELGLIDSVSIDKLIERIQELKNEIYSANKTLAEYCAEVDPGRCSLDSTIRILIAEVLGPATR